MILSYWLTSIFAKRIDVYQLNCLEKACFCVQKKSLAFPGENHWPLTLRPDCGDDCAPQQSAHWQRTVLSRNRQAVAGQVR